MRSMPNCLTSTLATIIFTLYLVLVTSTPDTSQHQQRKALGETKLHELQTKTESNTCWREAVDRLNSTCKELTDIEQSRLAVAFANCHLGKSGREVYLCDDSMSVHECTESMDDVAFQTYTEFFTHTGHICYFLQSQLWQERTDSTISRLSDASSETVDKLEKALHHHEELAKKQDQTLDNQAAILDQDRRIADSLDDTRRSMDRNFNDMNEMAQKHKLLLAEMFGTLHESVEGIRYLMSLFLIEFVGYQTFAVFVVACLVVLFLPQFGYSRFKLYLLLLGELVVEVLVRRLFGYFVLGGNTRPPPESMDTLHSALWWCRYIGFFLAVILYLWEWLTCRDHTIVLSDIRQNTDMIMARLGIESPTSKRRASEVPQTQSGPPPPVGTPVRHSWPLAANSEVPLQPPELTSRDNPSTAATEQESVDGCIFSKKKPDRLVYQPGPIPRGGRRSDEQRRSAYLFEPIPGLDPPIGHPQSPYTNDRISQYIASLPAEFETPGEQSFASTAANPPDSDQSNDTIILSESESPLARQPLKMSPIKVRPQDKNSRGTRETGGRVLPLNESIFNLSPGSIRGGWAESEKEVAEEKDLTANKHNTPKSSRQTVRSRRTEPLAPPTPTTPTVSRRQTLQLATPTDTPRRYNLRSRTPKSTPVRK